MAGNRTQIFVSMSFLFTSLLTSAFPVWAASPQAPAVDRIKTDYAAHKGEFDFLLGSWKFTAIYKQPAKTVDGYWDAVRLTDGGYILDEIRAVDAHGVTYFSATTLRSYDAGAGQWQIVTLNEGSGLSNRGTGRFEGGAMQILQNFAVSSPAPFTLRLHYYAIGPNQFSYSADRSTDGGKTWLQDYLQIVAHRVGPARSLDIVPDHDTAVQSPASKTVRAAGAEPASIETELQAFGGCDVLDLDRHASVLYTGTDLQETGGVVDTAQAAPWAYGFPALGCSGW